MNVTQPQLRPELEPLPIRMCGLPVDERGFPVPYFVAWIDGKPEFRAMDTGKWQRCVRGNFCWVCGHRLGSYRAFVIGPMCAVNRTTAEPPSHLECARWSARNCPFLSRPHMVRRQGQVSEEVIEDPAGIAIRRNPGVTLIWVTHGFEVFHDGAGKPLIQVGDPVSVEWWSQGHPATRAEVCHAIETGLPLLRQIAEQEGAEAVAELERRAAGIEALLPKE
jgi:hypothetical protein